VHQGVLSRYGTYLPLTPKTPIITLGEGSTPLVAAPRIAAEAGCSALYLKLEGCNPTGSFKDRGMVLAVAKALEEGSRAIVCASTGNTSASAAAFGARCGLATFVLVPKGNIAAGKLAQAIVHGAKILALDGSFDDALDIVRKLAETHPLTLVNSVNPYRLEGQKTAAFEVVDDLGDSPDLLCIPVGNAGNISAYWRGFKEYKGAGNATKTPKMMGYEAAGAAPIVLGRPVPHPETIATAIRIGNPASWKLAEAARDESGGAIDAVTDDEIIDAYQKLAQLEGIFVEPASAASVAGLLKLAREGYPLEDAQVVCVLTGSGLKDPDTAMRMPQTIRDVAASYDAVVKALESL